MDLLRVVTLNIWNRQGPWDERAKLIRKGLASLAPDLVGLQEVLRLAPTNLDGSAPPDERGKVGNQAEELAAGLGYYAVYGKAHDLGFGLDFGNGLLSRYPILEADVRPLPVEQADEKRAVLYALCDVPGGPVPVFVTHFSWKLHQSAIRQRQVLAVVDFVAEKAKVGATYPPILMGDFNAEPDSHEMRFLRGLATIDGRSVYFADCFALAGDGSRGATYARSNRYAARSHEPDRRIDYIYTRGPDRALRAEPLASRLVFTDEESSVFPSDHYGVYAEIQLAPRSLDPL